MWRLKDVFEFQMFCGQDMETQSISIVAKACPLPGSVTCWTQSEPRCTVGAGPCCHVEIAKGQVAYLNGTGSTIYFQGLHR